MTFLLERRILPLRDDGESARIGWNYPQAINLARLGYGAGYLQEDEAWNVITPAAERLQKTFSSWQELGAYYVSAWIKWHWSGQGDLRQTEYAYRMLLSDQDSPWRKYPWNLDLGNGYRAPPSVQKTAQLELAAHPEGLICVRITVPDHQDEVLYEWAIENAVGCRPNITGQKRIGPDWILDTECFQPNTLHGAEIVAHFHPEAIAEQLRQEGVTQLLTIVEHIPHGSSSEIVPSASDDWIINGWHWYFGIEFLQLKLPDTTLSYGVPPRGVRVFLAGAVLFVAVSLAGAYALRRRPRWAVRFPLIFWGAWLVLSVSFHGLAIAGFWSGGEGLGADVRGLVWYGALALLLRWGTAIIIAASDLRAVVPDLAFGRILHMTFFRIMTEVPFAIVLVLLCDPQRPISLVSVIALLGLGAAIALTAAHYRLHAEGLRGGLVNTGELYDAVWAMAKRMGVPLRRLYILPEEISPRVGPRVGAYGDLLIPERLIRSAYQREVDGIVAHEMMLMKIGYLNSMWAGVLPILVIIVLRIYSAQYAPSASVTLVAQVGMALSAIFAFERSLRRVHSRALDAFCLAGGDAEGWIAGLARVARLSGTEVSARVVEKIAQKSGVASERLPDLLQNGLPDQGNYRLPDYDHWTLVPVS